MADFYNNDVIYLTLVTVHWYKPLEVNNRNIL